MAMYAKAGWAAGARETENLVWLALLR